MVYARWYFCYQAKVSAEDTMRYLEILSVIEEDNRSGKGKLRALAGLERMEMLLQGYAVPVLVQSLFSSRSGEWAEIEWDYQEKERFLNKVKTLLKKAAGQSQQLADLANSLDTKKDNEIIESLKDIMEEDEQSTRTVEKMDYLETDLYRKEILVLSILRQMALACPEQISELVRGESRHPFIKNVLNGIYGQLAWNLAIEILSLCQEAVFGLISMFPFDWFTRPDMMELAAKIQFKGSAEQLLKESYKYIFLREHFQTGAEYYKNFWISPYAENDEFIRLCAVMWQNILWMAALKSNPDYSIREINKLWKVSQRMEGMPGEINSLNYVQKKFIPYQAANYTWEEILRKTACPWMESIGEKGKKNWGKYPKLRKNYVALKIFAAIPIMQQILMSIDKEEENFNFVFLILQWSAALSCPNPRYFFNESDKLYSPEGYKPWAQAVCLLGCYANRILHRIGVGKVNVLLPGWVVNQIDIVRSGDGELNEEIGRLCNGDALDVAAHWACSSLAEHGKEGGREENPWFAGGSQSCAADVCSMIFENGIESIRSRYALLLAYQAYPEYMEKLPNSWISALSKSPQFLVNIQQLIKEKAPSHEEWRQIGSLNAVNFNDESKKMALTMRLSAALESEEENFKYSWIQEWADDMVSVNTQNQLSSLVRYEMVKLLQLQPMSPEGRNSLFGILKIIIQVIDEFTTDTSFYYQKLLIQQLEQEKTALGEQSWEQLRLEFIMDLYSRLYDENGFEWKDATEEKYRMLLAFMVHLEACLRKRNYVKELLAFWKKGRVQSSRLRFERRKKLDAEQTLACHMWAKDGSGIVTVGRKVNFQQAKHDGETAIVSLFDSEEEINETCQYVGIIMGKKENKGKKDGEYQLELRINYGKSKPAVYVIREQRKTIYSIGDVVFMKFRNGKVSSVNQEAFLPQDGDFINGEVQIYPAQIVIRAWGEKWEINGPAESLNMWCPDLSGVLLGDPITKKCQIEWRNGQWMPVTKDFSQLIAEQFVGRMNREISMTFIRQAMCGERVQWIFSYEPGLNYGIFSEFMDKECCKELIRRQSETDKGAGLIMNLRLNVGEGDRPLLSLSGAWPIDDKNIRWKNQFAGEDMFVIKKNENGRWRIGSRVPEIGKEIVVNISGRRHPSKNADKVNVQLEGEWDFRGQRNASVNVELIPSRRLSSSLEYEQLYRILNMKAGDFVELNYVECKRDINGYYPAYLTSGIRVKCAAESFSALNVNDTEPQLLYEKRRCVIEYIGTKSFREENADFKPYVTEELYRYDGPFQGIIAEVPENIQGSQEQMLEITVNLLIGGEIQYIKAPASAFALLPVYVGEPVIVEWADGGWKFTVQPRNICVRALWNLKNHKAEQGCVPEGRAIGIAAISGMGTGLLTQGSNAILHFYRQNIELENREKTIQTERHFSQVQKGTFRRCSTRIFPETYETLILKACDEDLNLIGEARNEEYDEAEEWKAEIKVRYFSVIEGEAFYDLRRVFVPLHVNDKKEQEKALEQNEEYLQDYREWYETGEFHAVGGMKRNGENVIIRLYNISVPMDVSVPEEEFQWTKTVPLKEEEHPWLQGKGYRSDEVRVKLQLKDNTWTASYQEAEPMWLNQDFANLFNGDYENGVEQVLYFAGIDENEKMRFEWGYGYKLLASQEDVTDMDGNLVSQELFCGDKIIRFCLIEGEGEFGWRMRVAVNGIVHELEHRIMEDGLHDVIQLLEVCRDIKKRQVKIQQVSMVTREIGSSGWTMESMPNAMLDDASVEELLKLDTEEDVFVILGKQEISKDKGKMTSLRFSYIPLDGDVSQTQILEDKVLCLVAGGIRDNYSPRSSRIVNDCSIDFYLQKELPERNLQEEKGKWSAETRKNSRRKVHLRVNVPRRYFSLDESRLRVLQNENPFAYYRSNMLVRLRSRRENSKTDWNGSVIAAPLRSEKCLKEWVLNKQPRLVILGNRMKTNHIQIEIAPGILSLIKKNAIQEKPMPGALASLRMEGEELKAELLLPGDGSYIPKDGRAVELLVMDGALNGYGTLMNKKNKEEEEKNKQRFDFTVAGFPQLRIKDEEFLEQVITEEPPRLAYLSSNFRGEFCIHKSRHVAAVFLKIDKVSQNPILEKRAPQIKQIETKWNYISCKDGTIGEIIRYVERGRWHYHDQRTGIWQADEEKMVQVNWPDSDSQRGVIYSNIPLFPAAGNRLRYTERELEQMGFCYSARELCENGLPEKGGWYPVAAANTERIWIELLPGRVLDIPKKYLFIGSKGRSLANMAPQVFAAGDEIKLGETKRTADELPKILVEDVRFGMRFAFRKGVAYLPVEDVRKGGLVLGSGRFHVTLPEADTENWTIGSVGRLDMDNTLSCCNETPVLKPGDVVMLVYDRKFGFQISGMPQITVRLSYRSLWRELKWLYDYLWNRKNAADNLFQDGIPVRVSHVTEENGQPACMVLYEQPIQDQFDEGTELCCNVIGGISDTKGTHEIVLRSGGYLFKVNGKEFISGLSEADSRYVCQKLSDAGICFWMHREQDGWQPGLREDSAGDSVQLELLACIPQADGIVCRDIVRYQLWWLPARQAARVRNVPAEHIFQALQKKKEKLFQAQIMKNGTVSLIHAAGSHTRFVTMGGDNQVVRVIPLVMMEEQREETYHYLAELHPGGDIVSLLAEHELNIKTAEPIPVNVVKKEEREMVVVPVMMKREKLNLSPWMIAAYRESYRNGRFSGEIFAGCLPERYRDYTAVIKQSIQDAEEGKYQVPDTSIEGKLVYLHSIWSNPVMPQEKKKSMINAETAVLRQWVRSVGLTMATGFDAKYSGIKVQEMDLLPSLAAVLMLDRSVLDRDECKKLAVHLSRVLGMLCNNSLCQEYILNQWLLQKEQGQMWARLSGLSLGGENIEGQASPAFDGRLTVTQKKNIIYGCRSIKNHKSYPEELRTTAECLLFAVGAEEDYSSLYEKLKRDKSLVCSRLAYMYRTFLPGAGLMTAADKLDWSSRNAMEKCFQILARENSKPVTLITDNVFPMKAAEKKWAAELCRTVLNWK